MSVRSITEFNGIQITDLPIEKIISIIRNKELPPFSYIVTPNIDHFYRLDAHKDSDFIEAYKNASLRLCDSRIAQKVSLFSKQKINNVVPGSDLTRKILESEWAKNIDILLIGPEPREAELIKQKYSLPRLHYYTPPMGFIKKESEILKCIDVINKSQAHIVFLAVGSPQQEILANRVKASGAASDNRGAILLCIGASIDFLSGKISRAPSFMQKMHIEWLHRALSDPKRLIPRYWKNFVWLSSYLLLKNSI